MKKIKNKGFTLTEILAVITIMTIIALLVTAGIMGYFRRGKEDYNKKLANQLVLASKTYFAEHKEELPTSANKKGYAYVTLPAMQSNNYIAKSFVDSEGRECSPSYVYVKQRANNPNAYDYYPCLICQDKKGNKTWHVGKDNKYCDPKNWEGGNPTDPDGPINPSDEDTQCEYVRDGDNVTITTAQMPSGILSISYIDEEGVAHIVWQAPESPSTQLNNIQVDTVPTEAATIYMEDSSGNKVDCNEGEEDNQPIPTDGSPVCKFVNAPSGWISSATTFQAVCQAQTGKKIALNDITKITADSKTYGTFTASVSTSEPPTDTKITFDLKFTPKSKTEGKTVITLGEGTVKNTDDNKTNPTVTSTVKSDKKDPVIKFTPKGSYGHATAKKDKGKGYYNKVAVTITCSDSGSGVSAFKVKIGSGSYTTVNGTYTNTKTSRGKYKYTGYCKDVASNDVSSSKTYRVLKKNASCSKCGTKKSACTGGWATGYNLTWHCRGKDGSHGAYGRCSSTSQTYYNSGVTCRCQKDKYEYCRGWGCSKGKTCWY